MADPTDAILMRIKAPERSDDAAPSREIGPNATLIGCPGSGRAGRRPAATAILSDEGRADAAGSRVELSDIAG